MSGHQSAVQKKQEKKVVTRRDNSRGLKPESRDLTSDIGNEIPSDRTFQRHSIILSRASPDVGATIARQLQQKYGNRYIQRVIESVKSKATLTAGAVDNPLQPEARVAQRQPASSDQTVTDLSPAPNREATRQPGGSQPQDISREPEPAAESQTKPPKSQEGTMSLSMRPPSKGQEGAGEKSFDLDQWLSGKLYELVKAQLGEDKLKGYAQQLSKAAIDRLLALVNGATSLDEFTKKIVVDEIGKTLQADLDKTLISLLGSAAGQKVKQAILSQSKENPRFVVGMILMALGASIAANADIPELEKSIDLGAGFTGGISANLGKFRDISINKLVASFSYTSKNFQASISGGYETVKGEGGFGGKAEMSAGGSELKFNSKAEVDGEGNLKLDFRQLMDLKNFGVTAGPSYESVKGWTGVLQLRIGNKYHYLTPKVTVDEDGNAKFELGHTFTSDMFKLATTLKGTEELSQKLDLKNPFGVEGLSLSASYAFGLEDLKFKSAGLAANIKLTEGSESSHIPAFMITIGGQFQAAGPDKPQAMQGSLMLVGHWK